MLSHPNGEWRMVNDEWRIQNEGRTTFAFAIRYSTFNILKRRGLWDRLSSRPQTDWKIYPTRPCRFWVAPPVISSVWLEPTAPSVHHDTRSLRRPPTPVNQRQDRGTSRGASPRRWRDLGRVKLRGRRSSRFAGLRRLEFVVNGWIVFFDSLSVRSLFSA